MFEVLKKTNKYVYIFVILYLIWITLIPIVINSNTILIEQMLSSQSGMRVSSENPKSEWGLLPYLNFSADKFFVNNQDGTQAIVIDNLRTQIRLLPLITGRVHINDIYAENLYTEVSFDENFYIEDSILNKLSNSKIKVDDINIKNYDITIGKSNIPEKIKFKGEDFIYKKVRANTILQTNGSIITGDKEACLYANLNIPPKNSYRPPKTDLTLEGVNLKLLSRFCSPSLKFSDISGTADITLQDSRLFIDITDFLLRYKDSELTIKSPHKLILRSDYYFNSKNLVLKNAEIIGKDINIRADGEIKKYLQKTPEADFDIKIIDTSSQVLVDLLPAIDTVECDIEKLKHYGFKGIINGQLSINGKIIKPNILGKIVLSKGEIPNTITNKIPKSDIELKFDNNKLYTKATIPTGENKSVEVDGTSTLRGIIRHDFQIKSSDYIDLHLLQKIVVPLHEIFKFKLSIFPYSNVNGLVKIDLKTKEIRGKLSVNGETSLKNATIGLNNLAEIKLYVPSGALLYFGEDIILKLKDAKLNNRFAEISGKTNLSGDFDIGINSSNQSTEELFNGIKSTVLPAEVLTAVKSIKKIHGNTDIDIKLNGKISDEKAIILNKNVFIIGTAKINNNRIETEIGNFDNIFGKLNFNKNHIEAELNAKYFKSPLHLSAVIKNNFIDINFYSDRFELKNLIPSRYKKLASGLIAEVRLKYKGELNKLDLADTEAKIKLVPSENQNKDLKIVSGNAILHKGTLKIVGVNAYYKNNPMHLTTDIIDFGKKTQKINGSINAKKVELAGLEEIEFLKGYPILKDYKFLSGTMDIDAKIKNNHTELSLIPNNAQLRYLPLKMPIKVISGNVVLHNDRLYINKVNALLDTMPILVDGKITQLFKTPILNLYINSKPKQEFVDKYLNRNHVYPLKLKGDILCFTKISGATAAYNLNTEIKFEEDSTLYYMGATLGDKEHDINLLLDMDIHKNRRFRVNKFKYSKLIYSQDNRLNELPLLNASGLIIPEKGDINFTNFTIKTTNPTDARVFNIIFKRPNIKQGQFNSSLKVNGKMTNPHITGKFSLSGIDIPFLNTTIKDVSCEFKDNVINLKSNGEALLNKYVLTAELKNKLVSPYRIKKAELYSDKFDINEIVSQLKQLDIETSTGRNYKPFESTSIIVDEFRVIADKVSLRNINAENFDSVCSFDKNKTLTVKKFAFNIAQGRVDGNYKHNYSEKKTELELSAYGVNANTVTEALFDLRGQLYGDLTGTTQLACTGETYRKCLESLSGKGEFIVQDGNMPKLGSLEYLLKAGNLVKSGVTGLSINGIIDLIIPLKTGEFKNINGLFIIDDGFANTVKVYTNGEDLNLFLTGTYDFRTSIADMRVFGRLSRQISTLWGTLGNLSLNTLLNTIPGINSAGDELIESGVKKIPEFSSGNKTSRRFTADIYGDINGKDYVKSFRWIN